jgi:XTP/dITP diphosphohydrolase
VDSKQLNPSSSLPKRIFFASTNKNKVFELREWLKDTSWELLTPADFPELADIDVEETGETFADNALLKAKALAELTKLPTLADDSGLVIDVLNGEPGVKSKRYAPGSDHDRNHVVLDKLSGKENREARFVTVLCWYDPSTQEALYFEGIVEGTIANSEKGSQGFGYDPIFIPEGYDQTFAELGIEIKNTLSHRARALQKFHDFIEERN